MPGPQFYLAYGGGLGDVVWDYLRDPAAQRLRWLVESHGARIRVYTQCHNAGVKDLFRHHPFIHEHITEDWHPPTPEDADRFRNPIDGYLPLQRESFFIPTYGIDYPHHEPELYVSHEERVRLGSLLARRPAIVVQPYAGLSDRDGFDPAALQRLAQAIYVRSRDARLIVVGFNHDRGFKWTREEVGFEHPSVIDTIDTLGIRAAIRLVQGCDAFCGSHSNLIRTAWDHQKPNVCVMPNPSMTSHLPKLDRKYTYGFHQAHSRIASYPFGEGVERDFSQLDCEAIADFLLFGR